MFLCVERVLNENDGILLVCQAYQILSLHLEDERMWNLLGARVLK
jgi:hypothetical protein